MNNEDCTTQQARPQDQSKLPLTNPVRWTPPIRLTPREAEIVRYVVLGESNKQIARRLGISNYTVRDHVSNLLKKSGVTSRSRLALVLPSTPVPSAATLVGQSRLAG